jgi:hypothetical protein
MKALPTSYFFAQELFCHQGPRSGKYMVYSFSIAKKVTECLYIDLACLL